MKKTNIITSIIALAAALAAAPPVSAQTMYDALLFSQNNYTGSARTMAMGNAFTALGGDPGSIVLNPAASAVSSKYQLSFTGGMSSTISKATGVRLENPGDPVYCFGDITRTNRNRFILPNFALSASFNLRNGSALKRISFGITTNTTDLYQDNTYANGNHYGTSIAGYLASNVSAPYSSLIDKDAYNSGLAWDAVLAAQSGMISTITGRDDVYVGVTEKYYVKDGTPEFSAAGTLSQEYGRLVKGSKNDVVINCGFDISDWIYLGVNLGMQYINYDYDWYLKEAAQDYNDFELTFNDNGATVTTWFKDLKYNYWYKAKGSGIYGKLGILLTPGKHFRVGATVQTPTALFIKENYGVSGETHLLDSRYNSSSTSPSGEWSYNLTTPWRGSLGLATTFGKWAAISADYEVASYKSMRFGTSSSADDSFRGVNTDIGECMGAQHNLRLGAEFKFLSLMAIRLGYGLQSSPVLRNYDSSGELVRTAQAISNSVSGGLGIDAGVFYADLAVRGLFYPVEYILPYDHYCFDESGNVSLLSPEIRNVKTMVNAVLTLGLRF